MPTEPGHRLVLQRKDGDRPPDRQRRPYRVGHLCADQRPGDEFRLQQQAEEAERRWQSRFRFRLPVNRPALRMAASRPNGYIYLWRFFLKRPDASNPKSIRHRMRKARFKWVESLLDDILSRKDVATILDVGGRRDYWELLDPVYRSRIHLTILNTEEDVAREDQDKDIGIAIKTVVGDGTNMPEYADGAFDLVHSNSVIEHVGLYRNMAAFAHETRRVGQAYFHQTPNFWFPLEPHYGLPFIHWLPEPTRLFLHSTINCGYAKRASWQGAMTRVDHTRIVSRRLLTNLFPDGTHDTERFALLAKSLIVYRRVS